MQAHALRMQEASARRAAEQQRAAERVAEVARTHGPPAPEPSTVLHIRRSEGIAFLRRMGWEVATTETGTFVSARAPDGNRTVFLDEALRRTITGRR